MSYTLYLDSFEKAADHIDKQLLNQNHIEVETGLWLKSVVLRMQKPSWANRPYEKPQTDSSIFFSIWINDESIKKNKIFYNIHALKLRQLKGYSITSRLFAENFRARFKQFESLWPNVTVDHGPLTLMQGYIALNPEHIQKDILELSNKFLTIEFIIDDLLRTQKLNGKPKTLK